MLEPIGRFIHRIGRLVLMDRAADPAANGELQRNATHVKVFSGGAVRNLSDVGAAPTHTHASHTGIGTGDHHPQLHATAHQPAGGDPMAVDAAAATGSLRTLGAAATQAAAGNHTHAGGGVDIGVRAFHSAAQSFSTGVETVVALNSERWDTDAIHDTATNNSRLTCKTSGKYVIIATIEFSNNATGHRYVYIRLNGTTNIAFQANPAGQLSGNLTVATIYNLAVNDYVEIVALQASGAALDLTAAAQYSPEFSMQKVLG